jgi:hypothetical protein
VTTGQLTVKTAAVADNDVMRYADIAGLDHVSGPTPATSVNGSIAGFVGTTGRLIAASLARVDIAGSVDLPAGQEYLINGVSVISGAGNVEGPTPAASTDGGIVGWVGTGGREVASSLALVDIAGSLQIPTGQEIIVGRIRFPASPDSSSNANTLDEYQEGTWTPVLRFGGTGISSYTNQGGFYTKIGNVVMAQCRVTVSSIGGATGDTTITGLPFSAGSGTRQAAVSFTNGGAITFVGYPTGYVAAGASTINLGDVTEAGSANPLQHTDFTSGSDLAIQCTFEAA